MSFPPGKAVDGISVAQLKNDLPILFDQPAHIGLYGVGEIQTDELDQYSNLMEAGAVSELAKIIGEIVKKLAEADPQEMAKAPSWFERLLGGEVERRVRYQVARKSLSVLLDDAEVVAQNVRDTLTTINSMIVSYREEAQRLEVCIQAGREFLSENPEAGAVADDALQFDRPRDRFARKLANLATLLSSHHMSITQMQLTRAQAVDMLDRFNETATVLVPVWRQHTLALITTQKMSPQMVSAATESHQRLMRSLSKTLEEIDR